MTLFLADSKGMVVSRPRKVELMCFTRARYQTRVILSFKNYKTEYFIRYE